MVPPTNAATDTEGNLKPERAMMAKRFSVLPACSFGRKSTRAQNSKLL